MLHTTRHVLCVSITLDTLAYCQLLVLSPGMTALQRIAKRRLEEEAEVSPLWNIKIIKINVTFNF